MKEEDVQKIDEMYEEIKSKIKGKLGCVCISLNLGYNSEIRKKFIESGKLFRFSNIQIINNETATYLNYIFLSTYFPKNGDIIWISQQNLLFCFIWQKTERGAKLVKRVIFETAEEMKAKLNSGSVTAPDIIIYGFNNKYIPSVVPFSEIQSLLPKCIFIKVKDSEWTSVEGTLIKARILVIDSEVLGFDAQTQLLRGYRIDVN